MMTASLHRRPAGVTWVEPGAMARAGHAVVAHGRVWLIDPFEDAGALAAARELGTAAGVIQLLDRHRRDGERLARELGVPLLRMPDAVPDSPFEVIRVVRRRKWNEISLWWESERTLIVSEAIGTAPLFALGRRAGVHPLLRLAPPHLALGGYAPRTLLVGHGPPIEDDAAPALAEALDNARRDIPRLLLGLPRALRER